MYHRYLNAGSRGAILSGATGWDVKLIRAADNKPLAHQTGKFPIADANGFTMGIPALQDGDYKLQLWFTGTGLNQQAVEHSFPHVTYPWINNDLGKADVLIPPFTAMVVDQSKKTVETVLRRHTMNSAGLWTQVKSQDIDLMTGPMRLEVASDGHTYTASGAGASFSKRTPTKVIGQAVWSAGPIRNATTLFDYDYDGLMKVTLKLPVTSQKIDSLKLIIPVMAAEAPYMHEVTDLCRPHQAQSIPAGSGKVWDSAKVWRYELPPPFLPYIWIGGAERGIAWVAENDRDWIIQPSDAAMELNRNGDTVELVVKMITVPSVLTRERTIQFALQASPTKPMPTWPANWRRWGYSWCDGDVNFEFFGNGRIWGQQMDCTAFYPAFRNFSIFDEFVKSRQLGVNDGAAFTDKWMKQFPADLIELPRYFGPQQYRDMVNAGLGTTRSRRSNIVKATKVSDAMEGKALLPLKLVGGDANCSYQSVTTNLSPFVSSTFPANSASALLSDNSKAVNPSLETSGFGINADDWANIQLDVRPAEGEWDGWKYVAAAGTGPVACAIRTHGKRFALFGRRTTEETPAFIDIPNIEVVPGDWYHFFITCTPSGFPTAQRTCEITITHQDNAGVRTYGTARGVLQEGNLPIDTFRIGTLTKSDPKETAALQVDNLLINTIKPFWLVAYTNGRGINWMVSPTEKAEAWTYNDEWTIFDVADPRWDKNVASWLRILREWSNEYNRHDQGDGFIMGVWYDVDPIPSMTDMMLYYHRKMLENGMADGIYWDDIFLRANYNPVLGPGYIGDDGKIHAGVNIYAFRDLIKRTSVMQYHDLHMIPLTNPHMTNSNIIPILSFSTVNLDAEDIGSGTTASDFQDRFGLDKDCAKAFVEMTGFQTGSIGTIHDQFHGDRPHTIRTAMAVALVHEFKVATYDTVSFFPTYEKLSKFGYGKPDCKVYRYWEGPQPVTASGAPVKMLVLQRPQETGNKAYVIVGSFGEGGDVNFSLDATKLGLPAGYRVYDDETGAELPPLAPNQYSVSIVKHEYKLIRIQ